MAQIKLMMTVMMLTFPLGAKYVKRGIGISDRLFDENVVSRALRDKYV